MKRKKSISLVIIFAVVIMVATSSIAYLLRSITEKRFVDLYKAKIQALNLAEAAANRGVVELRKRIRETLYYNVKNQTNFSIFENYTYNDYLGLLRDFANFSITNTTTASFYINGSAIDLSSDIKGNYNAIVIVKPDGEPQRKGDKFIFQYNYTIEGTGKIVDIITIEKNITLLGNHFNITVQKENFARYAIFTNHCTMPSGQIVWFINQTKFTGPVHTNDRFSFANNPSGYFSDEVTQHLTTARFYNQGQTRLLNADSNPPYDVPTFEKGFQRGAGLINLPSSLTQQDLKKQATGNQNDDPWPNGIYLPNDGSGNLVGGIYIKGNTNSLIMEVDTNNRPVYTIRSGSNTKKITIDYNNNMTIVQDLSGSGGTPTGNYTGIPDGINNEGIIIYGNGRIYNLSGTVQKDTKLTVSSDSDIVINNHIMYQEYTPDNPETTDKNELSAEGYNNLLGILTWNGNVRISTSAPNNLNIHAIVMAAGRNGIFTVDNYNWGSPRGTVTLLGGAITDFYGPFGTFSGQQLLTGYGRNFIYDKRMLEGFFPAYFPYSGNLISDDDGNLDKRPFWYDKDWQNLGKN